MPAKIPLLLKTGTAMKKEVILDYFQQNGAGYISISFEKDWHIINQLKKIAGVRFSVSRLCWYLPATEAHHEQILRVLADSALVTNERLLKTLRGLASHQDAIKHLQEKLMLKGYSSSTQRTYLDQFKSYLHYYLD